MLSSTFVFVFLFQYGICSDWGCLHIGGVCQDDSNPCPGHYVDNMCEGIASRRCCVESTDACSNIGGTCQDDHSYCSGSYITGKCNGGVTNRCCTSKYTPAGTRKPICDNIRVISRDEWGARRPTHKSYIHGPVQSFVIHHTDGHTCHNEVECVGVLKGIQNYHINTRGYNDIGYSFLIGQDGHVYEGRGWTVVGAHTKHYNTRAYAATFMGNYMNTLPTDGALAAAKALTSFGVSKGHLLGNFSLFGHRDLGTTLCPGDRLYSEIQTWTHYNVTHSILKNV